MTNRITRYSILSVVLAFFSAAGVGKGIAQSKTERNNVMVSISRASCSTQGKLSFDWVITGSEKEPVYVYGTFLKGPAVSLDFDESSRLLTIWTSRSSEADFAVNDYPRAKFLKLQPGSALRGRFVDSPKRKPPIGGVTQLAFAVAFGRETESVETALREAKYIHPANQIVQWQRIATSPPVPLHSCTLKSATSKGGEQIGPLSHRLLLR
jgi:hypothetical protein